MAYNDCCQQRYRALVSFTASLVFNIHRLYILKVKLDLPKLGRLNLISLTELTQIPTIDFDVKSVLSNNDLVMSGRKSGVDKLCVYNLIADRCVGRQDQVSSKVGTRHTHTQT